MVWGLCTSKLGESRACVPGLELKIQNFKRADAYRVHDSGSNSGRHSAIINDFIMSSVKVDLVKPEAIENPRKKSMNLGLS